MGPQIQTGEESMQQRLSPRSLAHLARKKESNSVARKEVKMGTCAFFMDGS